jgi:hypothetical protein
MYVPKNVTVKCFLNSMWFLKTPSFKEPKNALMDTFSKMHTLQIDISPTYACILRNRAHGLFKKVSAGTVTLTAVIMQASNRC